MSKNKLYLPKIRASAEFIISAVGLTVLAAVYTRWFFSNTDKPWYSLLASFLSVSLFAAVCLRFVPGLVKFFRDDSEFVPPQEQERKFYCPIIFFSLLGFCLVILLIVYIFRLPNIDGGSFIETLDFWRCLDSNQYIHIAEGWYPSEGAMDDLVCLVFLPAYPISIKLVSFILGDYLYSAFLVSGVCFAFAGCALYKLMLHEYGHSTAVRAVKYMCLLPGSFFYAAPMSESMFLLFFILCIYFVRTDRWLLSGLSAAAATFTRSLGLVLFGILLLEYIRYALTKGRLESFGRLIRRALCVPLSLLGFAAYLLINYLVSGDAFRYMEYQSEHWSQNLGWFFNTAEYQTRLAVQYLSDGDVYNFTGLWLPNLIAAFGALLIILAAAKKLRASMTAGFIAYYVIAIGATWLLSAPRYLCACLPLIAACALLAGNKRLRYILDALLLPMNIIYLYAFAMRWNVW